MRFNPRPPLQAGASCSSLLTPLRDTVVSILARLYRRALLRVNDPARGEKEFQSSPAFTGGRFIELSEIGSPALRFNPRPPLQAGASQLSQSCLARYKPFQSSPAFTGGRFRAVLYTVEPSVVSILARLYRRALHSIPPQSAFYARVSILARLYRRALPQPPYCTICRLCVSILARLYRRALQELPRSVRTTVRVSILARLYRRALRI